MAFGKAKTMDNPTAITSVAMISIYAPDYLTARTFYTETLGLADWSPMGENACYIKFGQMADGNHYGMYIIGGRTPAPEYTATSARATFALEVPSAGAMFRKLQNAGVRVLQDEPMNMGGDWFWFQFLDPAGNVIEILGNP